MQVDEYDLIQSYKKVNVDAIIRNLFCGDSPPSPYTPKHNNA